MREEIKNFHYSGNQVASIDSAHITASVYGTTMRLNFPADKKSDIVKLMLQAKIHLDSVQVTSISVQTPLHKTENIKKTLEVLTKAGFINQDFAEEIATNYPNGHGGTMDLNNPSKRVNALLIMAASSIYKSVELEGSRKSMEEYNDHEFKP
ncbi:hypothetical protein ACFORL_10200 [Legionella dresdenensis]|uniref:Uncharacterized protein n=1 Tax=Legionella dresdenensis TaxID=450200 RepID=A0ABV8CHG8_9GAMM